MVLMAHLPMGQRVPEAAAGKTTSPRVIHAQG